jgi:predicted ATPase
VTELVRSAYKAELATRGFASDPAQLRAIDVLERCSAEWATFKARRSSARKKLINRPNVPRGVYMHGGVGRGKSFLMDRFYGAVPLKRKTRLHFHEFMREVHRDRILPAIALLKANLQVISVDNGTDYRRRTHGACDALSLTARPRGRSWPGGRRKAEGVVWFDFRTLCGGPRSQNEYLEIASQFHTVLLSDVPHMPVSLASEARRFTWLVDVLYDRHVRQIMSAAVAPEALY